MLPLHNLLLTSSFSVKKDVHPIRRAAKNLSVQQKAVAEKTVLIVNPSSCSGLTGKGWDELYPKIKAVLGGRPKVVLTKKGGDGTVLASAHLKKGFTRIVALGGDGTLNEVANGFFEFIDNGTSADITKNVSFPSPPKLRPINANAMMAIVPCGTRNVLAKSLGLPEGVVECCRTFSLGSPRRVDVISATVTNTENKSTVARVLLNAAEIGLGAEIIDRSKKVRKAINNRLVSTVAGIVFTLPTYQSNECEVSLDDGTKRFAANMTMAVVANGSFLGGGFKAAPKADMSDGLLDLVILKDSGSLKMLDELVNLKDGDYSEEDNIYYRQVRKVSITSKERDVTVTVDGEPIGILPATFEVLPHVLTIRM